MKMKRGYKIKGYQSLKLYIANDILMGLTHFNKVLKASAQMRMTNSELYINEQYPVIHL